MVKYTAFECAWAWAQPSAWGVPWEQRRLLTYRRRPPHTAPALKRSNKAALALPRETAKPQRPAVPAFSSSTVKSASDIPRNGRL